MNIQELIEKQRAIVENPPSDSVNVVVAGEQVEVTVTKIHPDAWQALVAAHPPRTAATVDSNMGYNVYELPRDYPADRIKVGGNDVTSETWKELFSLIDSTHKNNVHTLMWGLNVYAAIQELAALGKAAAGRRSASPATSASRPAASKAGSPRKSRSTTPPKEN